MASIFHPSGEDVEDICGKEELVTFTDVPGSYAPDNHMTVKFQVGSRVQTSPFDWIGIFPSQWEDIARPLATISLPYTERNQNKFRRKSVTFSADSISTLQSKDSKYQFVYVDSNRHILGVSALFTVSQPRVENECKKKPLEDQDRNSGEESESESPVLISSASEEDEDWDLDNQSNTPQPVDPTNEDRGLTGGSSTSDLSDIVVLSTSPSQEVAKSQEQQQEQSAETVCFVDVLGNLGWSLSKKGTVEECKSKSDSRECWVASEQVKDGMSMGKQHQRDVANSNKDDRSRDEDCMVGNKIVQRKKCTINALPINAYKNTSLMNQLKIMETPNSSEEEDEGFENAEAFISKCPQLITEMEKPLAGRGYSMITKRKDSESSEPIRVADRLKTRLITEISSSSTVSTLPAHAPTKKSKKAQMKSRRERRRGVNRKGEHIVEGTREFEEPEKPRESPQIVCFEDEVLSGWSVGNSKSAGNLDKSLELEDHIEPRVKNQLEQAQCNSYQGRVQARTKYTLETTKMFEVAAEGELYDFEPRKELQEATSEIGSHKPGLDVENIPKNCVKKSSKPKKDKTGKRSKQKIKLNENPSTECSGNRLTEKAAGEATSLKTNISPKQLHKNYFSQSDHQCETLAAENFDTADSNAKTVKKKATRGVKAKEARKVRKVSSSRKKPRLSCEFQYLFSMDVKVGRGKSVDVLKLRTHFEIGIWYASVTSVVEWD
ncbi:calcium-binding and coiled-coil domain-containing protein 2-like [Plakobranchus ocellatus]|uniref:Calcium-binding and coiled-coil domain-containing protein 2-like n=1 Tax=Plakobranchus ocellatus TaxID=259542 RepID=A0AAV3YWF3_9GAST|nr:calcium-binding and coiled-coil domain-containing protein 2-like [Plakobranchus ocellatus]